MTLGNEDGKVLGTTNREMKDLNGRLLLVSNDDYCDTEEYKKDIKNHLEKEKSEKKEKKKEEKEKKKEKKKKNDEKSSGDDSDDGDHSSAKEVFDSVITKSDSDTEGKDSL